MCECVLLEDLKQLQEINSSCKAVVLAPGARGYKQLRRKDGYEVEEKYKLEPISTIWSPWGQTEPVIDLNDSDLSGVSLDNFIPQLNIYTWPRDNRT